MYGIPQEERLLYVEDFLHRAHIGGVGEKDVTRNRQAADIGLSKRRNNDLANRVRQVVRVVVSDSIPLYSSHQIMIAPLAR